MDFMKYFDVVREKYREASTWDGTVLVVAGVAMLLAKSLVGYIAWGAIAYGTYKIYKKG